MTLADRLTAGAPAETARRPAHLARTADGPAPRLAQLQRLAGNRATAGLVQRLEEGGEKVPPRREGHRDTRYHGMARSFELFLDSDPPPFTLQMCSLTDDPVGHAWIGLKASDGSHRTLGFWPNSVLAAVSGPGALLSEDPHAGGQNHLHERQVSAKEAENALDVIAEFDGSDYSFLARNCADFAVKVWTAVTGESVFPERYKDDAHSLVWYPLAVGKAIDERNRLVAQARGK